MCVPEEIGPPSAVLADTGYANADAFDQLARRGVNPYVPPFRADGHHKRTHDFRPVEKCPEKMIADPRLLQMRKKLDTDAGRALYAKRKQTVEPVFGAIKQAMGCR